MDICFAIFIDIHRFLIYNNVMVDIPIRITQKVLIIEDDQDLAKMYKNHLEGVGCQVLHVDDGRKGFETAKAEKPDVILLDLRLPGMYGIDVLKLLKGDPDTKKIVVFVLTNMLYPDERENIKDLGAVDIFIKAETTPGKISDLIKQYFNK